MVRRNDLNSKPVDDEFKEFYTGTATCFVLSTTVKFRFELRVSGASNEDEKVDPEVFLEVAENYFRGVHKTFQDKMESM